MVVESRAAAVCYSYDDIAKYLVLRWYACCYIYIDKMNRRSFLKLCCAAVVAPSLPIAYPELTEREKLIRYIKRRRDAARQALLDDSYVCTMRFNAKVDKGTGDFKWVWVGYSVPLNYKQ